MNRPKPTRRSLVSLVLALAMGTGLLAGASKTPALEKANMNSAIKPGEDFYRYANGHWIEKLQLPADKSSYDSFTQVQVQNQERLHRLFDELAAKAAKAPKDSPVQKIGDFYATAMDTARIEALGATPLKFDMDRIASVSSLETLRALLADFHQRGSSYLFNASVDMDLRDSSSYSFYFAQSGLGLPDRDYYTREDADAVRIRGEYLKHVTTMFTLLGETPDQAAAHAGTVMKMETRLAKSSKTREEMRDFPSLYNRMTVEELAKSAPGFDWVAYLKTLGAPVTECVVLAPKFNTEVGRMMTEVPLEDWKTYLRWQVLTEASPFLSSPFVNENFRFFSTVMSGVQKIEDRWKRMTDLTSGVLGELVGQIYVEKYFPPQAKQRMDELVANLKKAFAARLARVSWMSDATRRQALEKLEAMKVEIGYPTKWQDTSKLHLDRSSLLSNLAAVGRFEFRKNLDHLGKPVDRTIWGMAPQTVNAGYNILNNNIIFPAGILQPPFFFFDADDAVNYGSIGMVIGHEMSHGFDDGGRNFDKNGNMRDWWTPEDAERFKAQTELLVKHYEGFTTADGVHVNGRLSLGENIADYAGLSVAWDAYCLSRQGKPKAQTIDGFTPDQRFFLAFAQLWRGKIRNESLKRLIQEDVHPWGEFRANGAPFNVEAFYSAFGIKPGDKLYRTPEQRPSIW